MRWEGVKRGAGAIQEHSLSILRAVKNILWPPLCFLCRDILEGRDGVCASCWRNLKWIGERRCTCCGYPLPTGMTCAGWLCGACLIQKPRFDQGRSVLVYNEASQPLILGLKHAHRTHMAPTLGLWMARAAAGLYTDHTWIVPVPLHWTRLWKRSYNQSALLGVFVSQQTGCVQKPVLQRVRATPSQGQKTRKQRRQNVQGAFQVAPRYQDQLQGRPVLLIDDVWTTGATLDACVRALKGHGASPVHVLTLARVALES